MKNLKIVLAFLSAFILPQFAIANLTYEGIVTTSAGVPLNSMPVQLRLKVADPNTGTCFLYGEDLTGITTGTDGYVHVVLGAGTNTLATGYSLAKSFSNNAAMTGYGSCSYTPTTGDGRKLDISVSTDSGATWDHLGAIDITSAPNADNFGGSPPGQFLQSVAGVGAPVLTAAQLSEFTNLLAGTSAQYLKNDMVNGATIPVFGSNPGMPSAGQMWFNSTSHQLTYWDGSAYQSVLTTVPPALANVNSVTNATAITLTPGAGYGVNVTTTTSSTSPTTGALVVGGGVGISKDLNVAGHGYIGNGLSVSAPAGMNPGEVDIIAGSGTPNSVLGLFSAANNGTFISSNPASGFLDFIQDSSGVQRPSYLRMSYGSGPMFTQFRNFNNGSAIVSGADIGDVFFEGNKDGVNYSVKAAGIGAVATQNWTASYTGTALTFTTTPDNSTTPSERMRIAQTGRVGIGTISPGRLLDLQSSANNPEGILVRNNLAGTGAQSEIDVVADSGSALQLGFNSTAVTAMGAVGTPDSAYISSSGSAGLMLSTTYTGAPMVFFTGGGVPTERMRILDTGSVGIGTTTPTSTLSVNGSFSRKIIVTTSPSYSVTPLDTHIVYSGSAPATFTLPSPAAFPGREISIRNTSTYAVTSSIANVVPMAGGAGAVGILPSATPGKWVLLVSDGTNWQIQMGN